MHQFKGKIKCKICGKNFKAKMERKKPVYICSGYANYGKNFCIRNQIEEEELIYVIKNHLEINNMEKGERRGEFNDNLNQYVKLIEVTGEGEYTIYYNDNTTSILSKNRLKF